MYTVVESRVGDAVTWPPKVAFHTGEPVNAFSANTWPSVEAATTVPDGDTAGEDCTADEAV
jgi:hypothetical protein